MMDGIPDEDGSVLGHVVAEEGEWGGGCGLDGDVGAQVQFFFGG